MNGPEHYRAAEELLGGIDWSTQPVGEIRAVSLQAQVHATLALAAATAYPAVVHYDGDETGQASRGWAQVTA